MRARAYFDKEANAFLFVKAFDCLAKADRRAPLADRQLPYAVGIGGKGAQARATDELVFWRSPEASDR